MTTTIRPDNDYCDRCGDLASLAWNSRTGGSLCYNCDRLSGRLEFKPVAWAREPDRFYDEVAPTTQKFLVAFDIDDTLWDHSIGAPDIAVVGLVKAFSVMPNATVLIWSAGGKSYAEMMARQAGVWQFADEFAGKEEWRGRLPDLFVDDNGIGVPGGKAWLYVGDERQV